MVNNVSPNKGTQDDGTDKKPHILVAEDDKEMCDLLVLSLRHEGYRVSDCSDGNKLFKEISLSYLLTDTKYNTIDLVISDIRMPGFSGLEVLKNARSFKTLPPFILITAFGNEDIHEQAKNLHVAAVLNKPFDIDELLLRAKEILCSENRV